MSRFVRRAWRPVLGRLGIELIIVFIGVYAAFAVSEYQARRQAHERREQLELALIREIEDLLRNTSNARDVLQGMIAQFDSARAKGERPLPVPLLEPVRVQNHMWESVLRSGAMDLFDVGMVFGFSQFYNEMNAGFAQLEQLRVLSETLIVPNLGAGPAEFYTADGKLRPKYEWYPPALHRLVTLATRIVELGNELLERLRSSDDATIPLFDGS